MMDSIEKKLLHEVAELDALPVGAYNIRANGQLQSRNTTANIDIVTKTDKPGIDIYIKPGTRNESVHIPVIISQTGLTDLVYNDFHIGEGADVTIIAGCGIHNCGGGNARHDGIHTFFVGKNARLRYVENRTFLLLTSRSQLVYFISLRRFCQALFLIYFSVLYFFF